MVSFINIQPLPTPEQKFQILTASLLVLPRANLDHCTIYCTLNKKKTTPSKLLHELQKLHRWIWDFCSQIDLCGGQLHFMHFFTF